MKKILILLIVLLTLSGCNKNQNVNSNTDNNDCSNQQSCDIGDRGEVIESTFKNMYEAFNDVLNSKGLKHRAVNIPEEANNIFKIIKDNELEDLLNKEESFVLFVSDPKCPWCRSCIETLIEEAINNDIETINVIHIWDSEGNEVWRNKYIEEDGKLKEVIQAKNSYKKLLSLDKNDLLEKYTVNDIEVGEKRIFAPTIIFINNDGIKKIESIISDKQEDSREDITQEMKDDMIVKIKEFFETTKEN